MNCITCSAPIPEHRHTNSRYCNQKCRRRKYLAPAHSVVCKNCGNLFSTARKNQKFCSRKCSQSGFGVRSRYSVPTGSVGAIGELLVAADLLEKGFEVFRALSPCCSCDLAILRNGSLIRVEVRTGYKTAKGLVVSSRSHRADLLAINCGPDGIEYEPALELK